jgi:hypothetical protein
MSYWNDKIEGSDFAFDAVGVAFLWIKKRLFSDLENVITKEHPEQSVAAYLCCLRLLGGRFRNNLSVHFGKRDLEKAKEGFDRWYELVKDKIPEQYREGVRRSAEHEFELFKEQIFGRREAES